VGKDIYFPKFFQKGNARKKRGGIATKTERGKIARIGKGSKHLCAGNIFSKKRGLGKRGWRKENGQMKGGEGAAVNRRGKGRSVRQSDSIQERGSHPISAKSRVSTDEERTGVRGWSVLRATPKKTAISSKKSDRPLDEEGKTPRGDNESIAPPFPRGRRVVEKLWTEGKSDIRGGGNGPQLRSKSKRWSALEEKEKILTGKKSC